MTRDPFGIPNIQSKPSIALLDADILIYRAGFATDKMYYTVRCGDTLIYKGTSKKEVDSVASAYATTGAEDDISTEYSREAEPVSHTLHIVRQMIESIEDSVHSNLEGYISISDNFRKEIATIQPYKGNRIAPKPTHYNELVEYLCARPNYFRVVGQEADDAIGIRKYELMEEGRDSVIVTTDKDLNMIPGWHFNWVTDRMFFVDAVEAWRCFYTQMLTGDRVDNIPGIDGIGPKRAKALLGSTNNPKTMRSIVRQTWYDTYPDGYTAKDGRVYSVKYVLKEIAALLWIRRKPSIL